MDGHTISLGMYYTEFRDWRERLVTALFNNDMDGNAFSPTGIAPEVVAGYYLSIGDKYNALDAIIHHMRLANDVNPIYISAGHMILVGDNHFDRQPVPNTKFVFSVARRMSRFFREMADLSTEPSYYWNSEDIAGLAVVTYGEHFAALKKCYQAIRENSSISLDYVVDYIEADYIMCV